MPGRSQAKDNQNPLGLSDRLALRPAEAAKALGMSERALRALLSRLPTVRAGSAVLIPVDALRDWLRTQAQLEQDEVERAVNDTLRKIRE